MVSHIWEASTAKRMKTDPHCQLYEIVAH